MRTRVLLFVARATVLLIFAAATPAAAQVLYGSVVGRVTDASSGVVPGATVRINQQQTSLTRTTTSDANGNFSLPTLPGGLYEISVYKEGFQTYTLRDIVVAVDQTVRVEATLRLGALTETIQVTAESALLQTDRAEVRSEVVAQQLQNLPVPIGRNYQNLLIMVPGITPPENNHSVAANPSRGLGFHSNGTTRNSNSIRIEGALTNNLYMPHVAAYIPALEAIETVSVVTGSFDADQGLAGGMSANVQIKSGSNTMHGSVFEYHFDNVLKARPYFLPAGQKKPKAINNQLGGTIGGRIIRDNGTSFFTLAAMKASSTGRPEDGSSRFQLPLSALAICRHLRLSSTTLSPVGRPARVVRRSPTEPFPQRASIQSSPS